MRIIVHKCGDMNRYPSLITKKLGVNHAYILCNLLQEGDRPISEFATPLHVTTASVTDLVDRLEEIGYVRRKDHKTDRRVKLVSLKPRGRSFAKTL